jgi:hypothetical protein
VRPGGSKCLLCGEWTQELYSVPHAQPHVSGRPGAGFFHARCAEPLFGVEGRCWECNGIIWNKSRWKEHLQNLEDIPKACPGCGAHNPLRMSLSGCTQCSGIVIEQLHPRVIGQQYSEDTYEVNGHKPCVERWRVVEKQRSDARAAERKRAEEVRTKQETERLQSQSSGCLVLVGTLMASGLIVIAFLGVR